MDRRRLLLLTLAALLVRLAFLLLEPPLPLGPVADERTWTNLAVEGLLKPKIAFSPFRLRHLLFYPPLYPYFIAVFHALGGTLTAVKCAQAVAGTLIVPAVGQMGALAISPRAGLGAAAVVAFYPELVWFSVHFWAETLFMAFLWWAFERLLAADASGRIRTAVAAGLLWGLATLTRETVLYFAPVAAAWLAWGRPRDGARLRGAAFLVAALLTVAPWTWRNWVVFHAFVPVGTAGGLNLYQGNALLSREEVYERYYAVPGYVEQYRWAREQGIEAILDRQPWWIFEKLRDEMPTFWEADSQVLYHVKRGAYGPVAPAAAAAVAVVVLTPYLVVLGFAVAGLAALEWTRPQRLLMLFFIYYNGIHVATHGYARYRLPILPVVFLLAAAAWAHWRSGSFPGLTLPRKALAAAAALVLAASLAPSIRLNLREPSYGFSDTGDHPPETPPPS